jgi:hypothetical protein
MVASVSRHAPEMGEEDDGTCRATPKGAAPGLEGLPARRRDEHAPAHAVRDDVRPGPA